MQLIPSPQYVVVKPVKKDDLKTKGGLLLGSSIHDRNPPVGEVLAAGSGVEFLVNGRPLAPGDVVIYSHGGATEYYPDVTDVDSKLALIPGNYILAVIQRD